MAEKAIEEMYAQTERGFPACTKFSLVNGNTVCTQSNMRKSVCEHTCDDGFILLGDKHIQFPIIASDLKKKSLYNYTCIYILYIP